MIFVTVGTHEQPFNRLIQKVDELKRDGVIKDILFSNLNLPRNLSNASRLILFYSAGFS